MGASHCRVYICIRIKLQRPANKTERRFQDGKDCGSLICSYIFQASHFSNFCGVAMDIIISRRSSGDINHLWGQGRFSRSCPNSSAPEKQGMMDRQLLSHAWRNLKWCYIFCTLRKANCQEKTYWFTHLSVDLVHRDWGCQGFGMQCQYSDPL